MSYWFGTPIPWFSSGRTRSRHADGIEGGIAGNVRDGCAGAHRLTCRPPAMSLQGGAEAFDQGGGGARKQIAPAFSARARTLSSGKTVMKMNGTR